MICCLVVKDGQREATTVGHAVVRRPFLCNLFYTADDTCNSSCVSDNFAYLQIPFCSLGIGFQRCPVLSHASSTCVSSNCRFFCNLDDRYHKHTCSNFDFFPFHECSFCVFSNCRFFCNLCCKHHRYISSRKSLSCLQFLCPLLQCSSQF